MTKPAESLSALPQLLGGPKRIRDPNPWGPEALHLTRSTAHPSTPVVIRQAAHGSRTEAGARLPEWQWKKEPRR